jgi:hypothetical protein
MKAFASLLVENGSQLQSSHIVCVALVAVCSFAPLGCGGDEPSADAVDAGGATYMPFQGDFESYPSWTSFTFDGVAIPDSPHNVAGPRTEYINHLPPKGATSFPVGTIIVKELSTGTFSMVKVGGDYNPDGALNWAWYELLNQPGGSVTIQWGPDPVAPAGDPYASSPVTCNQCHANASNNDFVQSWALNLARLSSGAPFDGGLLDDSGAVSDGASEQ